MLQRSLYEMKTELTIEFENKKVISDLEENISIF